MSAADLLIFFPKWQIGQGQQDSGSSTLFETAIVGNRDEKLLLCSCTEKATCLFNGKNVAFRPRELPN